MQLSTTKDIFGNLQILKKFNKQPAIGKMRNLEQYYMRRFLYFCSDFD